MNENYILLLIAMILLLYFCFYNSNEIINNEYQEFKQYRLNNNLTPNYNNNLNKYEIYSNFIKQQDLNNPNNINNLHNRRLRGFLDKNININTNYPNFYSNNFDFYTQDFYSDIFK